jgi:hypothetical protein
VPGKGRKHSSDYVVTAITDEINAQGSDKRHSLKSQSYSPDAPIDRSLATTPLTSLM